MFNKLNNLTTMKRHNFLFMTAAIAVLMLGVAMFTGCNKDDDKKDNDKQDRTENIYVDLGLPSGTLWKTQNESGQEFYTYNEAVAQFGDKLPTKEQFEELINSCQWEWNSNGYNVIGSNGKSIFLPAAGFLYDGERMGYLDCGYYWSSTPDGSTHAWYLCLCSYLDNVFVFQDYQSLGVSVRLVQD